jgi:hypothetical protein
MSFFEPFQRTVPQFRIVPRFNIKAEMHQNPRNQRIRSLGDCLIEVTIMLRRSEACVCLFRLDQPFDSKQYLTNLVDDDKGACSRKVEY